MVSVLASSAVDSGFIGGVMVSVLASSAVDSEFGLWFDPTAARILRGEVTHTYFIVFGLTRPPRVYLGEK
jgi:hypothetical protein